MENNTLYVFDMDGTLLKVPGVADFVDIENNDIKTDDENIKGYVEKIKGAFSSLFFKEICFKKVGEFIVILDCRSKKALEPKYLNLIQEASPEQFKQAGLKNSIKKDLLRAIVEKDGVVIFESFPGFYDKKETIGGEINKDIISVYKLAKNKMILTGRKEEMRQDIEKKLVDIGIGIPSFGLHLFPGGSKSIVDYKIGTILDSITENNWSEVHFFEDRKDWLDKTAVEVIEKFPEIKFHKHLIKIMN